MLPRNPVPEYFSATWRSVTPALTTTTPSTRSESTTRDIVIPSFLAYSDNFEDEAEDQYTLEDADNAEVLLQRPESSINSAPTTASDTVIATQGFIFGTQPSSEATTREIVIPSFLAYSDEAEDEADDQHVLEDTDDAEGLLHRPESSSGSTEATTSDTTIATQGSPKPSSEATPREIVIPSFLAYSDDVEDGAEDQYVTEDTDNAEVLPRRPESSI